MLLGRRPSSSKSSGDLDSPRTQKRSRHLGVSKVLPAVRYGQRKVVQGRVCTRSNVQRQESEKLNGYDNMLIVSFVRTLSQSQGTCGYETNSLFSIRRCAYPHLNILYIAGNPGEAHLKAGQSYPSKSATVGSRTCEGRFVRKP
jgi:hypothetical protein